MKKMLLVLLSCLFLNGCSCCENIIEQKTYDLVQIKMSNGSQFSGAFILGSGGISGSDTTYFSFYTNEKGAIKLHKVDYGIVTIYFTKDKPKAVYSNNYVNCRLPDYYTKWDLYVPEGSIVNEYDLNIK